MIIAIFNFENKHSERECVNNELWSLNGCNYDGHKCGMYGRLDSVYILDGCKNIEKAKQICRDNGGTEIQPPYDQSYIVNL